MIPFLGFSQESLFKKLMTTSDKMFVVVIVLLIIFLGIILFLTLLDKKIKQLEKKVENK
jgi:preprotein translocase subunit SecG